VAPLQVELLAWAKLTERQRSQARAIEIRPEQVEYAGSVEAQMKSIEDVFSDDQVGLGIVWQGDVIGLMSLKRSSKAPSWAPSRSAVISGLRLDIRHQGCGFGRLALLNLPEWVSQHWPDCISLSLAVDEENVAGIKAYRAADFRELGPRYQGRIGWVQTMSRPL
jgi:ribosomal protein S18 acetylase RimI-like enzyme